MLQHRWVPSTVVGPTCYPRAMALDKSWLWAGGAAVVAAGAAAYLARRASGLPGTIFTIVFENKSRDQVIGSPDAPFFTYLAQTYAEAIDYRYAQHPSLPAYIVMTAGQDFGINDDTGRVVDTTQNLGTQLTQAGIPWRAYGEAMPAPCSRRYAGRYMPRHMPFVYFQPILDTDCADHVVPLVPYFAQDLAADRFKYMWITPDACSDMHDCPVATGDAWLRGIMGQIMASPGYQRGGVVFILFDEGAGSSQLGALIVSPLLRRPGVAYEGPAGHKTYLATVEDLLGLPRLPAVAGEASMASLLNV